MRRGGGCRVAAADHVRVTGRAHDDQLAVGVALGGGRVVSDGKLTDDRRLVQVVAHTAAGHVVPAAPQPHGEQSDHQ